MVETFTGKGQGQVNAPELELTADEETRAQVQNMVKDVERQLLTATFNRVMNPGASGEQFDTQIVKIKDGLARIKSNPSWAKYLTAPTLAGPKLEA